MYDANPTDRKIAPRFSLRPNRLLGGPREMLSKIPNNVGENERNVSFGVGSATHAASATGQTLTIGVPRSMILRDLVIDVGTVRGRISSIKAEGEELHQGGKAPFSLWGPTNTNRPKYDLPVQGGTTVVITYDVDAAATIDVAFGID